MISKEDISLLVTYFKSLSSVPETLITTVAKLTCIDNINKEQDALIELANGGE